LNKSKNGVLSKTELENGLIHCKIEITNDQLEELFERIDDNNSGGIDYSEFVAASLNRELLLQKSKIESCFRLFDRDFSGTIELSEFKKKFAKGGMTEDEWMHIIKEVDLDGDGTIDLIEFTKVLKTII
jgi:calcium-dependent protein kinase